MNLMNVRVLVVEDEPEVREKYRRLMAGHHMLQLVVETDNSNEALQILQKMEIDAVILDLETPQGSGILFLEELQASKLKNHLLQL